MPRLPPALGCSRPHSQLGIRRLWRGIGGSARLIGWGKAIAATPIRWTGERPLCKAELGKRVGEGRMGERRENERVCLISWQKAIAPTPTWETATTQRAGDFWGWEGVGGGWGWDGKCSKERKVYRGEKRKDWERWKRKHDNLNWDRQGGLGRGSVGGRETRARERAENQRKGGWLRGHREERDKPIILPFSLHICFQTWWL